MTLCPRPIRTCPNPECQDTLIHQRNRQEDESSSEFGQYVHDRGERERRWREMFWLDVDGVVSKKSTGMLRIIEHKNRGGALRTSQQYVLPLLAKSLQLLAATGLIHRGSGVFVVFSDHPHESAKIKQIPGWPRVAVMQESELGGAELEEFLCGELMDDQDRGS